MSARVRSALPTARGVIAGILALLVLYSTLAAQPHTPPEIRAVKQWAADTVAVGLPDTLEPAAGVRDPVFAILAGLVSTGCYGTMTEERLERELHRLGTKTNLPYRSVVAVTRLPVQAGYTSRVTVSFDGPLDLPVPYSILGYHPGSFTASEVCNFREWEFPGMQLVETSGTGKDSRTRTIQLEEVHLFALETGEIWIDIDALIDKLLGGAIDDTRVTALVLCKYKGEWLGIATGYGRDQEGRSGILSLKEDKILFPTPDELKGVGRQLRGKAEVLSRIWEGAIPGRPPSPAEGR